MPSTKAVVWSSTLTVEAAEPEQVPGPVATTSKAADQKEIVEVSIQ